MVPCMTCWKPTPSSEAQQLQVGLGKLRRASGHFPGKVLALDPHRLVSYSQRDMMQRRPSRQPSPPSNKPKPFSSWTPIRANPFA